jgi:hypothetical protein
MSPGHTAFQPEQVRFQGIALCVDPQGQKHTFDKLDVDTHCQPKTKEDKGFHLRLSDHPKPANKYHLKTGQ